MRHFFQPCFGRRPYTVHRRVPQAIASSMCRRYPARWRHDPPGHQRKASRSALVALAAGGETRLWAVLGCRGFSSKYNPPVWLRAATRNCQGGNAVNRIYRLVWNRARQLWVAASEMAHGCSKAGRAAPQRRHRLAAAVALSLAVPCMALAAAPPVTGTTAFHEATALPATALPVTGSPVTLAATTVPTGGQVTAGSGAIRQSGATTTITQHSQHLSLNWQSFNLGAQATVDFLQPNAQTIAVNRIADPNGSVILGHLNANGQVYLINPNGVLFGQGAQVNVGGLVASTLDVSDSALGRGTLSFSGNGNGAVVNRGTLTAAPGGSVVLLGPQVSNQGVIRAQLGSVALAGGNTVSLSFDGTRLVGVRVDRAALNALAQNGQLIQADGGAVWMTAGAKDSLLASVVNNTGVIEARGTRTDGGVVRLVASGGNAGNSGTIDTSGSHGGRIEVLSDQDVMVTGGVLDASGSLGGGAIRVGGGIRGGEGLTIADRTYVAEGAVLNADATDHGQGGSIAVFSKNNSVVAGQLLARGGVQGGTGGFIETSSHGGLSVTGMPQVVARSAGGAGGEWLIDPNNITVVGAGNGNTYINGSSPFVSTNDDATLGVDLITTALAGGASVTVTTGVGGTNAQAGDITLNADLDYNGTGSGSLTFNAGNDILINNRIFDSVADGDSLNLTLNANRNINLANDVAIGSGTSTLVLNSNGAISQTSGVITAGTLTGNANGAVTLNQANQINNLGDFAAASFSLANAVLLTLSGNVTTSGAQNYSSAVFQTSGLIVADTLTGNTNGAVTLDQANQINNLGDFTAASFSLTNTVPLTLAGDVTTSGDQNYSSAVVLGADRVLTGTDVIFASTVDGNHALSVNANGDTTFGDAVGGLTALSSLITDAGGRTTLSGNVTTSGAQTYGDAVILAGTTTLTSNMASGDAVNFASTVDGSHSLTVNANGISTFADAVGGASALTSLTTDAGGTTMLNGDVNTSGTQTYNDAVTLGGDVALVSSAGGAIRLGSTVNGAHRLTVNTGGATTFNGAVGGTAALTSLTADAGAGIVLVAQVNTTGMQTYNDAVDLRGDVALVSSGGGAISLGSTVNGAHNLTVNTSGATTFGGAVGGFNALRGLITDAGGTTALSGNVTTSGAQAYGDAVNLAGDTTLTSTMASGDAVNFASTVDGAHSLTVNANGITTFGGAVGSLTALTSLTTSVGGTTMLNGDVNSSGAQTYNDAVTLGGDVALVSSGSSAISLGGTVNGAHRFTVNTGGATTFGGTVGGSTALTSLTTDAGGGTTLGGHVSTTGAQTYNDAVALGADVTLASVNSAVSFGSTVDNATATKQALTVNAGSGAVTFTGAIGNGANGALTSLLTHSGIFDANALNIGSGGLVVTTTAGGITQGGAFTVAGASSFDAGNNAITLSNASNDFAGVVSLAGGAVQIADANALSLDSVQAASVVLNAGTDITATGAVDVDSFTLDRGTWRQIGGTLPSFNAADFRVAGGSFLRVLGGDGSSADPYQLTDVYGLQAVGGTGMLGLYYTLANNIDASATSGWNGGLGFAPIGDNITQFTGTFDGLGHTVAGLTINRPSDDYVGLFGNTAIGSAIRNVGLVGGEVTGGNGVGALAGANGGSISQVYATSAVNGAQFVGGLVGANGNHEIFEAYATGAVTGTLSVGGLVGLNGGGFINKVYATGAVTGNGKVGGLVGHDDVFGRIIEAYSTGAVSASSGFDVGGLVGHDDGVTAGGYWDTETSNQTTTSGQGIGLTTAQMTGAANFTAWGPDISAVGGSSAVWRIYEGHTAPLLRTFMTDLAVTTNDVATTYNATVFAGSRDFTFGALTSSSWLPSAIVDPTLLLGDANASTPAINAGAYALDGGLYSTQMGYDLTVTAGTLTIAPALLTYTANAASTIYGTLATGLTGTLSGFVNGEDQASATTGTLAWSTAATATSNVGRYAINGSGLTANHGNYTFMQAPGNATALTIQAGQTPTVTDPVTNPAVGPTVASLQALLGHPAQFAAPPSALNGAVPTGVPDVPGPSPARYAGVPDVRILNGGVRLP